MKCNNFIMYKKGTKKILYSIEKELLDNFLEYTHGTEKIGSKKKLIIYTKGNIIFAVGCYDNDYLNPTVLQCNLKDLPDSPFFYDAIQEFLQKDRYEAGCVYEFVGFFRNYVFDGTIRKMELK